MASKSLSPLAILLKDLKIALSYLCLLLPNSFSLLNELLNYSSSISNVSDSQILQKAFVFSTTPNINTSSKLLSSRAFHLQIPLFTNLSLLIPNIARCPSQANMSQIFTTSFSSPFHMPFFIFKIICLFFPLHSFLVLSKFN